MTMITRITAQIIASLSITGLVLTTLQGATPKTGDISTEQAMAIDPCSASGSCGKKEVDSGGAVYCSRDFDCWEFDCVRLFVYCEEDQVYYEPCYCEFDLTPSAPSLTKPSGNSTKTPPR